MPSSTDHLAGLGLSRPESPESLPRLAEALEASWGPDTAYRGATRQESRAFGQCYPTSRVVQWFYPEFEIASGEVWTGQSTEWHFWNVRGGGADDSIDLTWAQFPEGSTIRSYVVLGRHDTSDSPPTLTRCEILLRRVLAHLSR
ncbi:YunG family protein [Brevundimonas sp.]|uniref:YunG family protein n=1 Tax=Brevundimonas sp. TaxID=1871086 RepID=UPI003BB93603